MSERTAMVGDAGAPFTIEHKGKTYTIRRVVTEEVMDAVEMRLYDKACAALYAQKHMMSQEAYDRKLDALSARFEAGEFSFESEPTTKFLATRSGVLLLLECMMDAPMAEIMVLLAERNADMHHKLKDVLALSFPKGTGAPKRERPRKARRRR